MSNNSDDDVWARVRAEAQTGPLARNQMRAHGLGASDMSLEPSDTSRGDLEARKQGLASNKLSWETTGEETDGPPLPKRRRTSKTKQSPTMLIGATLVSIMWMLAVGLFLSANSNAIGDNPSTVLLSIIALLIGPASVLLAAIMGESVAKSNREAKQMLYAARKLLEPERLGEGAVRSTATAVRGEIGRLESAIGEVAERLRLIEGNVESQTNALSAAGNNARIGADQLVATMENERHRLDALLAAMAELTQQAQASTQVASTSIDERAARLAAAADTLVDKSTQASDVAASAAQKLDGAAQRAVEAIGQLDQAAGRGEAALARAHDLMVLARLRADEAVSNVSEAVNSLNEAANSASHTAIIVSGTIASETAAGRKAGLATIEEIKSATVANALAITQSLREEADAARLAGAETLAALQASAEAVRFAAEEARQQASQQMANNQRHLDDVRQTAFEAGKDADAFMQTRLIDARALIEQSAGLLDETGNRIQERFTKLAAACADQARSVEDLLDGLDRRLTDLPVEANARAQAIETALNDTLGRLTQAGRKAADETAALDNAFQDRLRASYSALGEVVQRLGGLSGVLVPPVMSAPSPVFTPAPPVVAPPPVAVAPPPQVQEPVQQAAVVAKVETPMPPPVSVSPIATPPIAQTSPPTAAVTPPKPTPVPPPIEQAPLTPQPSPPIAQAAPQLAPLEAPARFGLKISSPMPIEDDPFAELEIGRRAPVNGPSDGAWSWKQVLSTLDAKGAKAETGRISSLIRELSLDSAIGDGDLDQLRKAAARSRDQGRRAVREQAGNEVRLMRAKLVSDPDLRASIVRFVEARREAMAKSRITGNEARVYLVADAALEA